MREKESIANILMNKTSSSNKAKEFTISKVDFNQLELSVITI